MLRISGHFSPTFFACLMLVGITGCGGSTGDGYSGARGQVSGEIKLDGAPLASGCQVLFMATTGGYQASGVVDDQGAYNLIYPAGPGLPAVEYQVQLTAPIDTTVQDNDPSKMAANMKLGMKTKAEDSGPFPRKYGSISTSKMSFPVKEGENKANFELSSK